MGAQATDMGGVEDPGAEDAKTVASAPDQPTDQPLGDGGKAALTQERQIRRAAEKELRAAMARIKELEDRDKTEGERLLARAEAAEKQAAEATARWQTQTLRSAIVAAATAANAIDADAVAALAAPHTSIGEDGTPTGVSEAIARIQAEKPHLFLKPQGGLRDAAHTSARPLPGVGAATALNDPGLENALRAALGMPTI